MRFSAVAAVSLLSSLAASSPLSGVTSLFQKRWSPPYTPKVFIISMFGPEEGAWLDIPEFDVFAVNVTVPGLSPVYPHIHCTSDFSICQITIGEAEINAATSVSALAFSGMFDLKKTYFMVAGIAGINPEVGTLGSVTFAKYAGKFQIASLSSKVSNMYSSPNRSHVRV
jgi:purine nucleoside permease